MYERSKAHLKDLIATHQRKLDYLNEARTNANAIIDAAFIRRDELRALLQKEKSRAKIEKFLKLQEQLKELEAEATIDELL